ncbi:MAG: TIM barrel protein [Thermoanaerobaculaceae bacterium]|nr:TIM barrel protein [Thermoanaerobaculaceae bacterium]
MIKLGLKIFSTDTRRIEAVKKCLRQGLFDYVELYAYPDTFDGTIDAWRSIKTDFIIHAAHFSEGMNLAIGRLAVSNSKLFNEAARFADCLNSVAIILHPGTSGSVGQTIRQIRSFNDARIVVENKPFINLAGKKCVGASCEEIADIMIATGCGFCLDIGHAIKYSYSKSRDMWDTLDNFFGLRPKIIHLTDGTGDTGFDDHLSFGDGNFPMSRIFKRIKKYRTRAIVTIETPKSEKRWLKKITDDFTFAQDGLAGTL